MRPPAPGAQEQAPASVTRRFAGSLPMSVVLLALVLAGLPLAVWLDLRNISETALRAQVDGFASIIGNFRAYYARNVVERVLAHHGETTAAANYTEIPGAIPIPARLSLELGSVVGESRAMNNLGYRFFSDYPFATRAAHPFDDFERVALATLRSKSTTSVYQISGATLDRRVRLVTPVLMEAGCVACHNADPNSPKHDWKVGDVRGIEEFTVSQPIAANIFSFQYLLLYFALVATVGLAFIAFQRHQGAVIARVNGELGRANAFLADIARKLSKYLSPQHYRGIFSGEKDVVVSTERKKLTIFFSDVVNFTAITEQLQPEELTVLLNEYLTEMSKVAIENGGTVNKYIGDAILVFFGDPESRGVAEDARACMRMAFEMQRRLMELNVDWRKRGYELPFRSRMGINTGYCNVGNFGSDDRMDYTIIGEEANLAARLQSIAQPGGIVVSYETFVLVSDLVRGEALEAIALKGIARPVIPYAVAPADIRDGRNQQVIAEHTQGLDLFLDVRAIDAVGAARVAGVLEDALAAVKHAASRAPSG